MRLLFFQGIAVNRIGHTKHLHKINHMPLNPMTFVSQETGIAIAFFRQPYTGWSAEAPPGFYQGLAHYCRRRSSIPASSANTSPIACPYDATISGV